MKWIKLTSWDIIDCDALRVCDSVMYVALVSTMLKHNPTIKRCLDSLTYTVYAYNLYQSPSYLPQVVIWQKCSVVSFVSLTVGHVHLFLVTFATYD